MASLDSGTTSKDLAFLENAKFEIQKQRITFASDNPEEFEIDPKEQEWEIEPEEAIKYRTIKKRRQTARSQTAKSQTTKSKSNSPKTKKKAE